MVRPGRGVAAASTLKGRDVDEVSIVEAAERLGVTENAVRKRIRRGSLPARKEGDRWLVTIPAGMPIDERDDVAGERDDALVEHLEEEIEFLRAQLRARDELIALLLGQTSGHARDLSTHLGAALSGLVSGRSG